ncbi:MAG: hybrid sensor histidine kinase/response regulator [Gracilimonas sp.]|uniref:hybrid sensor histidine kinase/response regulator n=1 Tax=Gracilimonas TaxID=649462 RepID=UPI001B01FF23|nr:hybrid sensor histidine kinase/response regulator [Gracilimonas sp.]MBO6586874.1 hybrid sensor histidine kinase/response regulator [Gracilimonas sp.]MBO6614638.1 hybrid sensor histidine kinase/response regulator [Gracilimonas sp.]
MKDQSSNSSKGFVLIVDDISKNLQLLGTTLREAGYKVAAVSKSEQVLDSALKYRPDLILLDVMMPGKSGFEVCEELKAHSDLKHIPVIFLTAKVEQESIVNGLNLGGSDYVTKPFNTQELLARVDTHISLKLSKDKLKEQNEKLNELGLMKDRIYSVIGHDLRGPVNGISGVINLLLSDLENMDEEKLKKFLTLINQSSSNLWNLLTDLLSWARVQSKEMKVNRTDFYLLSAIEEDIKMMAFNAEKKGININIYPEVDVEVHADKTFVRTIFRNFLSNALKFSDKKGHSIDVHIEVKGDLNISVKDYGIGMSEETKERLFKLTHPKSDAKMNANGAGFGLLLCNELAKLHGGEIKVKSEEGNGSTFTLAIPQSEQGVIAA